MFVLLEECRYIFKHVYIDINDNLALVLTDENKEIFESVQNSSSPRKTQHGVQG